MSGDVVPTASGKMSVNISDLDLANWDRNEYPRVHASIFEQ
jgi:hypothetical protein